MTYMVSLEDGEFVKMTADGFVSTGMYIFPDRYPTHPFGSVPSRVPIVWGT